MKGKAEQEEEEEVQARGRGSRGGESLCAFSSVFLSYPNTVCLCVLQQSTIYPVSSVRLFG